MSRVDLSILVVSYNTREITLECLASVREQTQAVSYEVLVVDNASHDGSAAAIAERFPEYQLIALEENIGFARANNLAAKSAQGRRLLLLNPDTVVLDRAIDVLWEFAEERKDLGLWGCRTLFEDRSLNPHSCWGKMTPWSVFCASVGLRYLFKGSSLFNPESYGSWPRDSVREVDIIAGCVLLIDTDVWRRLEGFDERFFMYGEDADLCLRARALGYRPTITPFAEIVHLAGRSEPVRSDKMVRLMTAHGQLMERHWPSGLVGFGRWMQRLWVLSRLAAWMALKTLGVGRAVSQHGTYREIWRNRQQWLGKATTS